MALQGCDKPRLSFSIASILRKREGTPPLKFHARTSVQSKTPGSSHSSCQSRIEVVEGSHRRGNLPWLNYSRYHPPKIPRSRLKPKSYRRKTSGKPRVPFSTSQLMLLEQKYDQSRYLSTSEVLELSTRLNLPEHRVKIWFQNRRAREKRSTNPDAREGEASHGPPKVRRTPFAAAPLQYPNINPTMWSMALARRSQLSYTAREYAPGSLRPNGAPWGIFPNPARPALFARRFYVPSSVWPYNFMCARECLQNVQSQKHA